METPLVWGRGRHATAAERARALRAYERSGLTQREFAQRHGMRLSTLGRWLRTERDAPDVDQVEPAATQFCSVDLPATGNWAVEVQNGKGAIVRLDHQCPATLAKVVLQTVR